MSEGRRTEQALGMMAEADGQPARCVDFQTPHGRKGRVMDEGEKVYAIWQEQTKGRFENSSWRRVTKLCDRVWQKLCCHQVLFRPCSGSFLSAYLSTVAAHLMLRAPCFGLYIFFETSGCT